MQEKKDCRTVWKEELKVRLNLIFMCCARIERVRGGGYFEGGRRKSDEMKVVLASHPRRRRQERWSSKYIRGSPLPTHLHIQPAITSTFQSQLTFRLRFRLRAKAFYPLRLSHTLCALVTKRSTTKHPLSLPHPRDFSQNTNLQF